MCVQYSYNTDIHYDANVSFDEIYYVSRYRFDTEELAQKFICIIEEKYKTIISSSICYDKTRSIIGYIDKDTSRPKFYNLDIALSDLEQMIIYCNNNYYYTNRKMYKYYGNIFTQPIATFNYLYINKLNEKLKKQIEEMEQNIKNIPKIINEKDYSINELEDIIKASNDKISKISNISNISKLNYFFY